jgi:hypothetical protein
MAKHRAGSSPLGKHNVANYLYKASLLNTVCLVAGLSIFFFGYDQGLMGGKVERSSTFIESQLSIQ